MKGTGLFGNSNYSPFSEHSVIGRRKRGGGLRGQIFARPAAAQGPLRPEVDGVGGAADLQFLSQHLSRCRKPALGDQSTCVLSALLVGAWYEGRRNRGRRSLHSRNRVPLAALLDVYGFGQHGGAS